MEITCDILDRVARKGLTEKMTFESRPVEGYEANHVDILRKSIHTETQLVQRP